MKINVSLYPVSYLFCVTSFSKNENVPVIRERHLSHTWTLKTYTSLWALHCLLSKKNESDQIVHYFTQYYHFSSPEHNVLGVSYCDRPVSGVRRPSCVVRRPQFASNDISSVTTWRISTKVDRIISLEFSTKIAQIVLLRCTKWPPELKIEKPLNDISPYASSPISK